MTIASAVLSQVIRNPLLAFSASNAWPVGGGLVFSIVNRHGLVESQATGAPLAVEET